MSLPCGRLPEIFQPFFSDFYGMAVKQNRNQEITNARPTTTINIANVGEMSHSGIQQAGNRAYQVGKDTSDLAKIIAVLEEIKMSLDALPLQGDARQELEAEIQCIDAQVHSPKPNQTVIHESMKSIRNIFEGMTGSLIASGIWQKLVSL
jgi:hypothetical protein